MKQTLLIALLIISNSYCRAQYSKDKLIGILTSGSEKSWTVKGINETLADKIYIFNKDLSVKIEKEKGKRVADKWLLTTSDNIRWFLTVAGHKFELIVSYDKSGNQYLKLKNRPDDIKSSVYEETLLYPVK